MSNTPVTVRSIAASDATFQIDLAFCHIGMTNHSDTINNCIKEVLRSWGRITGLRFSFSDITKDWSDDKYVSIFVRHPLTNEGQVQFIFEKPAE